MKRAVWNKGITKYKPKPCLCGCGELVKVHRYVKQGDGGFTYVVNKFIRGHGTRGAGGFRSEIHSPRLCACGCAVITQRSRGRFNRFVKGHENIGRTPWNKDKTFSEVSKEKMSVAHLGKEPANKTSFDLKKLYTLYVTEKQSALSVSQNLGVSIDAVKNRLRRLGWSRSSKESCSTPAFRDQMQKLRIKTLTSDKSVGSPNKLEQVVYNTIDTFGVPYQRQVPLFGKFVVDVLFPQRLLVVEIFGRYWHERDKIKKKDYSKKRYLEKCGYAVEELWDYDIKEKGAETLLKGIFQKYALL